MTTGTSRVAPGMLGLEHLALRPAGTGSWSPDGQSVAFVREDPQGTPRLFVRAIHGGERQVAELPIYVEMNDGTDRRDVMGGPQWSPTSEAIAVSSKSDSGRVGIHVIDVASGRIEEVLRHRADDRSVRWSPDGTRLAFIGHRDGRDNLFVGALSGRPLQLTFDRWDNTDPSWSPDGSTLAFISQRSDEDLFSNSICVVPASGGEVTQLTHDRRANDRSPRWAPDGKTIAFVSNSEDTDDIWLIAADGSGRRRLTSGAGDKGDPRWSPDGTRITFTHVRDGGIDIELSAADSGGAQSLVVGGSNTVPRWSPDGSQILYLHSDHSHPDELWIAQVGSGEPARTSHLTQTPGPSLDGIEFSKPTVERFQSRDGKEIEGHLYSPPQAPGEAGPAILWIRGGPNAVHVDGWHPLLQFFAQRGYTVFAPNYRGSTGSGRTFMEANFGVTTRGDMDDWLGAADFLKALPTVEPNRVAIMGRSYGGYAVLLALGLHPSEFRAGVTFCGPSNWFSYWEDCEIPWGRRLHIKLMGLPSRNLEAQIARSPVTYADRYLAPVLIFHGDADWGVPYAQAGEMADLLQRHGKQYEKVIYPGEGHVYSGAHAIGDSAARIETFLQQHLGPAQSRAPAAGRATGR